MVKTKKKQLNSSEEGAGRGMLEKKLWWTESERPHLLIAYRWLSWIFAMLGKIFLRIVNSKSPLLKSWVAFFLFLPKSSSLSNCLWSPLVLKISTRFFYIFFLQHKVYMAQILQTNKLKGGGEGLTIHPWQIFYRQFLIRT